MLRIKPRASHMLYKSFTEFHPQPFLFLEVLEIVFFWLAIS
jgi:hypothetical protein